jgi:hypothetical protein
MPLCARSKARREARAQQLDAGALPSREDLALRALGIDVDQSDPAAGCLDGMRHARARDDARGARRRSVRVEPHLEVSFAGDHEMPGVVAVKSAVAARSPDGKSGRPRHRCARLTLIRDWERDRCRQICEMERAVEPDVGWPRRRTATVSPPQASR